jgi:hypothetical protein
VLEKLFFVVRLICSDKCALMIPPAPDNTITCAHNQDLVLLFGNVQHVQDSYIGRQDQIFLSDGDFTVLIFFDRRNVNNEIFTVENKRLKGRLASSKGKERDFVGSFLKVGDFIDFRNVLQLLNGRVDLDLDRQIAFNIMFNLISFGLEILQYSSFFNDVIGKLFPLHIAITIDIDLIEQVSQVPDKGNITIGGIDLPELEMFFGDDNELFEVELIVFGEELFFEQLDGDFIEIKSHVGDHFVVGLLYVFV